LVTVLVEKAAMTGIVAADGASLPSATSDAT